MYELVRILYPQIDTMDCLFDFPYEKAIHKRFIELTQRMKDLSSHLLYMLLPDMISLIMDVISSSASEEELMLTKAKSMLERVADRTPLDEIARECGMPYSMFRKSFQKMYNISPGQYRIRFRINSAKQLLTEGYSVSVVAEMLNYPDIYSFSHQFSMVVGVPARDICSNPVNAVHAKE